jgi:hypothetical protein
LTGKFTSEEIGAFGRTAFLRLAGSRGSIYPQRFPWGIKSICSGEKFARPLSAGARQPQDDARPDALLALLLLSAATFRSGSSN